MSTTHASVSRPEDAEARYEMNVRLTSYGATVGSIGLAVQNILSELHVRGWVPVLMVLLTLGGWIVYGVGVYRNRRLGKPPGGRAYFEQARTDERLKAIRSEAFTWGFAAMLALQAVLLLVWSLTQPVSTGLLSVPVVASLTIAAGVTSAVLRHQILIRR